MSGVPAAPGQGGGAAMVVAPRARESVARLERSERTRLSYLEALAVLAEGHWSAGIVCPPAGLFVPMPTQLRGMADRDTMKPAPPQGDDPTKPQPKPGPPPRPKDDPAKPQPEPVQDHATDRLKESPDKP